MEVSCTVLIRGIVSKILYGKMYSVSPTSFYTHILKMTNYLAFIGFIYLPCALYKIIP